MKGVWDHGNRRMVKKSALAIAFLYCWHSGARPGVALALFKGSFQERFGAPAGHH